MKDANVVIMRPAGAGKTILAKRLSWPRAEADGFHLTAIAKLAADAPLSDDRSPWLGAIRDSTSERDEAGQTSIPTCSSLRRSSRHVLGEAQHRIRSVNLSGEGGAR